MAKPNTETIHFLVSEIDEENVTTTQKPMEFTFPLTNVLESIFNFFRTDSKTNTTYIEDDLEKELCKNLDAYNFM